VENQIKAIGKYRWTICALVFFATTVNYLDRQVISLLKSVLSDDLSWDDGDYANIEIAFKLAYSFGMLIAGRVVDMLGTKKGYATATGLWSLAAVGHGFANSTLGFIIARAALGITEAGNFPAAIKATAEWFPKKERAFATGIFNSGTNIGAIIAPLTVPFIAVAWGWKWAFILTGLIGFVWLVLWQRYYTSPAESKKLSKEEYDYIHSDIEDEKVDAEVKDEKVAWIKLLGYRQTWAFALGKFLTDPIWWFYLFWLPDFLQSEYHLSLTEIAIPVAVVYLISTIGSVGGGYLPMFFINRNMPAFKARKTAMFVFAMCVLPVVFSQYAGEVSMWLAVLIIGIAAAAHQAWSANIFTTVSDMFPKKATASVTGIGGMAGGVGGIVLTWAIQKSLFVHFREIGEIEKAYFIMFLICGGSYFLAWLVLHLLAPTMKRVKF
jgi:ACS family hexuronate transporter-like MFS transporter